MATSNHRALWDLTRGQRARFTFAMVALAIASLLMDVGPQIVRLAIDGILVKGPTSGWMSRLLVSFDAANHPIRALVLAAGAVLAATLVGGIFMYLKGRWAAQASESIARALRMRLYDHLQHLPVPYH